MNADTEWNGPTQIYLRFTFSWIRQRLSWCGSAQLICSTGSHVRTFQCSSCMSSSLNLTWSWSCCWLHTSLSSVELATTGSANFYLSVHATKVLVQAFISCHQRVMFKIMHQSLAAVAPSYLADDCQLLTDVSRRTMRSSATDFRTMVVPRTHNKFCDRSFLAAGPQQWSVQTETENVTVRPQCLVTSRYLMRYINTL